MAQISFDQVQTSQVNPNSVNFFSLADDGDEAIVRFLVDDVSDFDIVSVHEEMVAGKRRKVDCLRTPREPLDKCPLCYAGHKTSQRFFIHLLQYFKNPDTGEIEVVPCVWERSTAYCTTLKNLIEEYGPLSESIFKIRRNGAKGDMQTTYSIMFGNPNIYKEEFYPKNVEAFENFSVLNTIVLSKTENDMEYFLNCGEFPQEDNSSSDESEETVSARPVREVPNTPVQRPGPRRY